MQRLSQAVDWLGARLEGADAAVSGVAIDTRQLRPGDLFAALPGTKVDGHRFLAEAAAAGAAGALVRRVQPLELPQLVVPDVLAALQQLAAIWRRQWRGRLAAVTGSNGKTTVKTLLAHLLGPADTVLATQGNLNNHIGVPLSLLRLRPAHTDAVIEMGANHAGEIERLAAWAAPAVGIVTRAGDAHLEGFGSRDGVANSKGELFLALPPSGVAVINADDPYAPRWRAMAAHCQRLEFGRDPAADVSARDEEHHAHGSRFELVIGAQRAEVELPLPGRHNVMNALAAAAAAHALGRDLQAIAAVFAQAPAVGGRLQARALPGGGQLIDDSYNANPDSLAAAIEVLAAAGGERHLVLGDMAELGADAAAHHARAGRAARAAGIDALWTCGPLSAAAAEAFGEGGRSFDSIDDLIAALRPEAARPLTLLVKGSRSAGMERVVHALQGEG